MIITLILPKNTRFMYQVVLQTHRLVVVYLCVNLKYLSGVYFKKS